jgi:eukaryotic-like serine/threonine-protein kinase
MTVSPNAVAGSGRILASRYRLGVLLGRGAMAEVWSAEDLELGRQVALKLLAAASDRERVQREARAIASLAHPNVTRIFDYGAADGRLFIVLELISGGTLEDRLRAQAPLSDPESLRLALEIAAGLGDAHAHGIVHRDLKPANILLDEDGHAKLTDFGIARFAAAGGTLTDAGTVLGTAAYISPEQAAGEPATTASDVYSFGVILFRMLTGRLPFESSDPLPLLVQHVSAQAPAVGEFRPDAPASLAAVVAAALAKDPTMRPPDGAALLCALDWDGPVLTHATVALPPVAAVPARRRRRLRQALVTVIVVLLGFSGAALAYVATRPVGGLAASTASIVAPGSHGGVRKHPAPSSATAGSVPLRAGAAVSSRARKRGAPPQKRKPHPARAASTSSTVARVAGVPGKAGTSISTSTSISASTTQPATSRLPTTRAATTPTVSTASAPASTATSPSTMAPTTASTTPPSTGAATTTTSQPPSTATTTTTMEPGTTSSTATTGSSTAATSTTTATTGSTSTVVTTSIVQTTTTNT